MLKDRFTDIASLKAQLMRGVPDGANGSEVPDYNPDYRVWTPSRVTCGAFVRDGQFWILEPDPEKSAGPDQGGEGK